MRIPAVDLTMSEPSSVFSTSESMSISATMAFTSIRFTMPSTSTRSMIFSTSTRSMTPSTSTLPSRAFTSIASSTSFTTRAATASVSCSSRSAAGFGLTDQDPIRHSISGFTEHPHTAHWRGRPPSDPPRVHCRSRGRRMTSSHLLVPVRSRYGRRRTDRQRRRSRKQSASGPERYRCWLQAGVGASPVSSPDRRGWSSGHENPDIAPRLRSITEADTLT